jgi:hypothetical protein
MTKKPEYVVDYQLVAVVYFSGSGLSESELGTIWNALSVLGKLRMKVASVWRGDPLNRMPRSQKVVLGEPVFGDRVITNGDDLIGVFAESFKRPNARHPILDCDLSFGYNRDGIWHGEPVPPILSLSISGQLLEKAGSKSVLEILRTFFEVADEHSPLCGLVDLARPSDTWTGMAYGTMIHGRAPLARQIEQEGWLSSGIKKGDRLRGLYWGNYLGPGVLERLGGRKQFLESYEQTARFNDGLPAAQIWRMPNGVFLSLCLDPLDCSPVSSLGILAAQFNMQWLVRELATKGVLDHW